MSCPLTNPPIPETSLLHSRHVYCTAQKQIARDKKTIEAEPGKTPALSLSLSLKAGPGMAKIVLSAVVIVVSRHCIVLERQR
jgi:hypothetical protein